MRLKLIFLIPFAIIVLIPRKRLRHLLNLLAIVVTYGWSVVFFIVFLTVLPSLPDIKPMLTPLLRLLRVVFFIHFFFLILVALLITEAVRPILLDFFEAQVPVNLLLHLLHFFLGAP
jgi:hypothetical protein